VIVPSESHVSRQKSRKIFLILFASLGFPSLFRGIPGNLLTASFSERRRTSLAALPSERHGGRVLSSDSADGP
jgi:hypothetical protein